MIWLTITEHLCGYVPFVVIIIRSFPHLWLITGFGTRVTGRVQLVEQEHPISTPGSLDCCIVCYKLVFALLVIVLSALLRFTDFYNYLFGIIKLYLLKRYLKGSKGNINNQHTYFNLLDTSINKKKYHVFHAKIIHR